MWIDMICRPPSPVTLWRYANPRRSKQECVGTSPSRTMYSPARSLLVAEGRLRIALLILLIELHPQLELGNHGKESGRTRRHRGSSGGALRCLLSRSNAKGVPVISERYADRA